VCIYVCLCGMFRLKSVFVSLQRVVYVLVRLKKKKDEFLDERRNDKKSTKRTLE